MAHAWPGHIDAAAGPAAGPILWRIAVRRARAYNMAGVLGRCVDAALIISQRKIDRHIVDFHLPTFSRPISMTSSLIDNLQWRYAAKKLNPAHPVRRW